MKLDSSKLNSLCNEYYNSNKDYCVENDPDFTYQELMLIVNSRICCVNRVVLDTDKMIDVDEDWSDCIAHLYQTKECSKPWNKVLTNRAKTTLSNTKRRKNGTKIFWYQTQKYKKIYEAEETAKNKLEKIKIEEWLNRKEKQKIKQRERRANKKNGK